MKAVSFNHNPDVLQSTHSGAQPMCLVPECDAVYYTDPSSRDDLWDRSYTDALRRRTPSEQHTAIKELSERYGLDPRTVKTWKNRDFVEDSPMGPKVIRSTVLSSEEEATIMKAMTRSEPTCR